MSRAIDISYQRTDGTRVVIEVSSPYYLMGAQQTSEEFWSLSIWRQIGVKYLAALGVSDPIYFTGWDMLDQLSKELQLFSDHVGEIDFDNHVTASWLAHLIYGCTRLRAEAPADSVPTLSIG